MEDERQLWNRKYKTGSHTSLKLDPFFEETYREFIAPMFPRGGRALDVAGGVGRHTLWLAKHGWQVKLVDISETGIRLAKRAARRARVGDKIEFVAGDLKNLPLGRNRFDLILVFFYLERPLFPALMAALKPGGALLYKTYTWEQPKFGRGPRHPLHLSKPNELLRAFRKLRVLHYRESVRERAVAEFVGMKTPRP